MLLLALNDKCGQNELKQCQVFVSTFRKRLFHSLNSEHKKGITTNVVKVIGALIVVSIILAVVATEPVVRSLYGSLLAKLDTIVAIIFLLE